MNLFQTGRKSFEMNVQQMNPSPDYSGQLSIDIKKYKDLERMCKDGIIPKAHQTFYMDLAPETAVADDHGSESEYEDE